MNGLLRNLIILCVVSFNILSSTSTSTLAADESIYLIKLQNRRFVPEPGIDPTLREKLATSKTFPIHGIVQLIRKPTTSERVALSEAGIRLRQYLGGTAYHAEFSKGTQFNKVKNMLRWAGPLLPKDKIRRDLWLGKIHDWAKTKGGDIKVLIFFYKGVNPKEAERTISKFTDTYKPHGRSNVWATEIPQEYVKKLAVEEIVKWIEQRPLPFMPL